MLNLQQFGQLGISPSGGASVPADPEKVRAHLKEFGLEDSMIDQIVGAKSQIRQAAAQQVGSLFGGVGSGAAAGAGAAEGAGAMGAAM